jgi:predicted nucleic acid-binding protein
MMPQFLDTNILLYSISRNPAESLKRDRAIALLDDDSGALSIQVLQEFYVQATRTSRADAVPHEFAAGLIDAWSRFRIQDMTLSVLNMALRIRKSHGFSFWDSAIVAAALTLGCGRIYTEDLTHGQVIDGLLVINPFREPPTALPE